MNLQSKNTLCLQGNVLIPGSKSQSIRALLFGLLARGESVVTNLLDSKDTEAAKQVCIALGGKFAVQGNSVSVISAGFPFQPIHNELFTDNSGITTLFTLPLLGLRQNNEIPITVNCGEQMKTRPVKPLVDVLRQLGMAIEYLEQADTLPIRVTGSLQGGEVEIDGFNSQYLSALLISLPCAPNDSVITVRDLHERPYVNMTLDFLNQLGIRYTHQQFNHIDQFTIPGNQQYHAFSHEISADFSSASCVIAASVLLPGNVVLQGFNFNDSQGDKKLISVLQQMGADVTCIEDRIIIQGKKPLTGICIDANEIPDLVPALAVIATQAIGKTKIMNVSQARIKETDRIRSMTEGLRKMGAHIEEQEDGMTIYQSPLHGASVEGFQDHRTVMALSVAGLIAKGATSVSDSEAINKTFPEYIEVMQQLGAEIQLEKPNFDRHIILIGFKHVGKSIIGKQLAQQLNKSFIDLDAAIEKLYHAKFGIACTCRQIMQVHHQPFFRALESEALQLVLQNEPSIIALGGGTLMNPLHQHCIAQHMIIHVQAPRGIVYERIMINGRPAFFDPQLDFYQSFIQLWNQRDVVFQKITARRIENNNTIEQAVNQAMHIVREGSA